MALVNAYPWGPGIDPSYILYGRFSSVAAASLTLGRRTRSFQLGKAAMLEMNPRSRAADTKSTARVEALMLTVKVKVNYQMAYNVVIGAK